MELETTKTNTTAKLPMLKQGDYEMWRLRIEQYFHVQDYALRDVIENGNSFKPVAQITTNDAGTSTTLIPSPYKDAKSLFAAIQIRFGGNEATKKTLLKQMYENFSALSTESLDSIFNRVQKIVSQLAILDIMSFNDLYNNFNIVKQEVKGTANSSSSSNSQNMAFVSSSSSTNEVNTAYGVSTANTQTNLASTQVNTASTQTSTTNLSDATVYALLANQLNGNWNQDSSRRTVNVEETPPKAMVAINGVGSDWSSMAEDVVPTNMALMSFLDSEVHNDKTCSKVYLKSFETLKKQYDDLRIEFNKFEFNLATYKRGLASIEEKLVFYKKNVVLFSEQIVVLKRDISYKDSEINVLKRELEKLKQEKESNQLKIENFDNASKSLDKLIYLITLKKGLGYESYHAVLPPPTGLFLPLKHDLSNSSLEEFQQPEFEGYGPKTNKNVSEDIPNVVNESSAASLVKDKVSDSKDCSVESPIVVEKKTVVPTVAKVKFVRPKQQEQPVRKPIKYAKMYRPRPVNTARPRPVNIARLNSIVVNAVKSHPQQVKQDQGYVDSRYSRHMTGNMSYLLDFKEFNGGYVIFEGEANGLDCVFLVKTVNGEEQKQALVDKKKVIITKKSVRSDLHLENAEGTKCLPTATIFEQLTLMSQVKGILKHKEIYDTPSHTKKIFGNIKRQGTYFSGKVTPLFETMMVQSQKDMGEDSEIPTDSHHTPTVTQPSTSFQLQQNQKFKKSKKKITDVPQLSDSTHDVADEHLTTTSNDPLLSGKDRLKLIELIELCTQLQSRVLALDTTKANQALKIRRLKRRMKKLKKKASKKSHMLITLYKIGSSTRVESFEDAGLGDQEDASKQETMIGNLDANKGVALVDETQRRNEQDMFDTITTAGVEVVTIAGEVVTTVGVEVIIASITSQITMNEITLAKALIDIKTSKPKAKGIMLFNNTMKWIESFVPMDTELVKGSKKAVEGSEKAQEGSSKRATGKLEHEDAKRSKKKGGKSFSKSSEQMKWNDVRLQVDYEVEMAYDLFRLIRRQINEGYFKGGLLGLKDSMMILELLMLSFENGSSSGCHRGLWCLIMEEEDDEMVPEWSRYVTIVKQQHKLDEVSYYKLFEILKQYQKEVNELRVKGKEIAKPITPLSEIASKEDIDPEQGQRDKDM
nr:ribonuclease H-like domain-containing protein [Tanacetum cinerariifolium]